MVLELRRERKPERAAAEKAYLKSDLEFLGTGVPAIRSVVMAVKRQHPSLGRTGVVRLARALWAEPVHERRMAATILLEQFASALEAADLKFIERLIRESKTWAYVDELAIVVAGSIVERHAELLETLDRWSTDPDFWVRRSAMLALLRPAKRGGDFDRFARYADAMLEEKEFFIRKAIGWVLREVSKTRPELVAEWLRPRMHRASGITIREAVKYLPAAERERLLKRRTVRLSPAAASGRGPR
jgi:3-methyladenine DNA glycosylase AlkD